MATEIRIPDIGTTVDYVTVVKWLKKEGDTVARGEPLCEVETDKAVSVLESIAEGTVLKILAAEGTEVEQDAAIACVGKAGESLPEQKKKDRSAVKDKGQAPGPAAPVAGAKVPPIIRNLAAKHGVDLGRIAGTGPGGRITREDVLKATDTTAGAVPLSANQTVVARRVSRSHQEIPPISLQSNIDMTAVLKLRKGLEKKSSRKVCFDAFFIKAVATVIKEFPHFRSRFQGESVVESEETHVGIAIGVDHELYVPTVRNPDTKTLLEIDEDVRALAEKAKQGSFAADELSGATLTVSNLGMFPVRSFEAIILPGQMALLSVGALHDAAVVREGEVSVIPFSVVTLSVDHRLINGREAGEFILKLKDVMEQG